MNSAPNLLAACEPIQINNKKDFEWSKSGRENDASAIINKSTKTEKNDESYRKIVWRNVVIMALLHAAALNGLWLLFTGKLMWQTVIFTYVYISFASMGVTGGAHRLWAHKAYKAKLPFRIWLMLWQTAALQNDIHEWVRDHRVHHKYTDTDADPHNSNRGFFFCHVGWLLMKKHKDVIAKGKKIDMSDIEADPVVMWQKKYYVPLALLLTFIVPTYIPVYFWKETLYNAFYIAVARYVVQLNGTWAVNSAAHLWGYQPYDKSINPRENIYVSMVGYGEGWHNYHHTFPWDYKAAELGNYRMNFTTALLDLMAYLGQAYELKTVSPTMINKRAKRTGDGTRLSVDTDIKGDKSDDVNTNEGHVWGWDDEEMKQEDKKNTEIFNDVKNE